jgi:hypothetical protein
MDFNYYVLKILVNLYFVDAQASFDDLFKEFHQVFNVKEQCSLLKINRNRYYYLKRTKTLDIMIGSLFMKARNDND